MKYSHRGEEPQCLCLTGQLLYRVQRIDVPFKTALRYFISRMSSYVGFLDGPTHVSISSRSRSRTLGVMARRYIAKVRVAAVYNSISEKNPETRGMLTVSLLAIKMFNSSSLSTLRSV